MRCTEVMLGAGCDPGVSPDSGGGSWIADVLAGTDGGGQVRCGDGQTGAHAQQMFQAETKVEN